MTILHRARWLALALLVAGCQSNSQPPSGEDEQVKSRGTVEVTARLVEIPEGAIFERDLYHYAAILKYEVVAVHRGTVEKGATIYVAHYDPTKPRSEAADKSLAAANKSESKIGGTLRQFRTGQLHRMALETPLDDHFMGGIVDKYFGQRSGPAYWAVWTNAAE